MKEHEDQRDLHAVVGEAVGVAGALAFEQGVSAHFAQIVAQLVEPIAFSGQAKTRHDCVMQLLGTPVAYGGACVQQHSPMGFMSYRPSVCCFPATATFCCNPLIVKIKVNVLLLEYEISLCF